MRSKFFLLTSFESNYQYQTTDFKINPIEFKFQINFKSELKRKTTNFSFIFELSNVFNINSQSQTQFFFKLKNE